jgi:hypothetical protein
VLERGMTPISFTPSDRSGDPKQVLEYFGRYTHRVAIANSRLPRRDRVSFRWKDRHRIRARCL